MNRTFVFLNIINVFTATFGQFNASILKSINFFQEKKKFFGGGLFWMFLDMIVMNYHSM